ncbi:MAG: hypothetical protein IKD70_02435, partial [Eggerthellaceae bacterium]|nr:hypothetical protein [Eggerthellaceae bacterium]
MGASLLMATEMRWHARVSGVFGVDLQSFSVQSKSTSDALQILDIALPRPFSPYHGYQARWKGDGHMAAPKQKGRTAEVSMKEFTIEVDLGRIPEDYPEKMVNQTDAKDAKKAQNHNRDLAKKGE